MTSTDNVQGFLLPMAPRPATKGTLQVAIILFCAYLQNSIDLPGLGAFPGVLAALAAVVMFWSVWKDVDSRIIMNMIGIMTCAAATAPFSLSTEGYLGRVFLAIGQMAYLFFVGYVVYLVIVSKRPATLERVCFGAMLFLALVALLEISTPLRGPLDALREAYYGSVRAYGADERDLLFAGGVRPKAFASEPSYLALYYGLAFSILLMMSRNVTQRAVLLCLLVVGAWLVRSPNFIAPAASVGSFYLMAALSRSWRRSRGIHAYELLLVFLVSFYALAGGLLLGGSLLEGRLNALLQGEDTSYIIRIGAPADVMWRVLELSPFFGTGIGGNDAVTGLMRDVFAQSLPDYTTAFVYVTNISGPTPIGHWMFYGWVGGAFILLLINAMVRRLIGAHLLLWWAVYLPFSLTTSINSYHAWMTIFVLATGFHQMNRMDRDRLHSSAQAVAR